MIKGRGGHVLATVMFTDIVDSSRVAHELGDTRWRVLLARHHTIVRKALKRCHGTEIDNAGDGFFATFADQVDAIRCACAISDDVRSLGIEVRAGCHVGQAELLGRKLGGVTVHAGARVTSEAAPGEVLVSSMIKDLVPASGFEFADRGTHQLKGLDGEWHLYAVTGVDGTPRPLPLDGDEATRLRAEITPPPLVERRSGKLGIAALAIAFLTGAVILFLHRPHPVQVRPNSLVRIDPKTNEVVDDIPVEAPVAIPGGSQIAYAPPHRVWVKSQQSQVISIVDTMTNQNIQTVGGFGGSGTVLAGSGIAYGFGKVWVTGSNNTVSTVDPSSGVVGSAIKTPSGPTLVATGFGRVWVLTERAGQVIAIDPHTRTMVLTLKVLGTSVGIAVGEGAVWVSEIGGTLSRIDPRSGAITEIDLGTTETVNGIQITAEPGVIFGDAIGFGSIWVSDLGDGLVIRVDPATLRVIDRISVGLSSSDLHSFSAVAAGDGSMWVTNPVSKTVVRIDPSTNKVEDRIHLPYAPYGIVFADGSIWATLGR